MGRKLYVDWHSQPCRAVGLLFKANAVPFEEVIVSLFKGDQLKPDFVKLNPMHSVPVLEEDGWVLRESVAILKYVASQREVAEHWYPTDLRQRAKVDEFMAWYHGTLRKHAAGFFYPLVVIPAMQDKKTPPDPETVKSLAAELDKVMDMMESNFLQSNKFLSGNEITIADLLAITEVMQPISAGYDACKGRPKVAAWIQRVKERLQPHFTAMHEPIMKFCATRKVKV